jgi:hypothetical protein
MFGGFVYVIHVLFSFLFSLSRAAAPHATQYNAQHMSSDEENENGLGADLDDEIPETPVGTRRLIKLKRRNPSTAISTSTSTATTTTTATSNFKKRNAILSQDVYSGNGFSSGVTNGSVVDGTKKKMLDISKILDKVKNSTNYSGYLSNSSFNNSDSISNYKGVENGWKTGSLFDDEDDDNDNDHKRIRNGNDDNNAKVVMDPPVKAKAKIKAKTGSTTKKAKSKSKATATHTRTRTLNSKKATKVQVSDADPVDSDRESVNVPAPEPELAPTVTLELEQEQEENGVIETPVKRKRGPNKAKKSTAAMSTITKKSTAKTLRRTKGMTLVDETPMSSEKANVKKRTAHALKETKEKAEVQEQPVVKKSKTANTNTNTKSSTDTKTAANVKANRTVKGRTRNAVKKDVESSKMKTSKSKSNSNSNSKGKNKAIEESSFSLFEVLDISATERPNKSDSFQSGFFGDFGDGDNDDDDDDDEVFVLESPVMKKRKATGGRKKLVAVKRGVESGIASKRLAVESEKESDTGSVASEDQDHDHDHADVQIDYGDPFLNDEFEDIHHDNNREEEHLRINEEEKRQEKERELMELERITSSKLLKQKAQEEKDRKLQEREEQRRLERLRKEEEIKRYKEKQRQTQIRKESKAKKLETLRKLKESIKEVITPESVISAETYTIPLRDEDVSNSEIKPRRASLASRGRRMSSIGNGFVAMPHDDIPIEKLHEHIDMSLPDSYKLKQLLVWISKRMLKSMDFIGESSDDYDVNEDEDEDEDEDDEVNEKYKMICQELFEEVVNDLTTGRIDIDWWGSQSDSGQPIAPEQSEEDIENAKKLTFYENEVKKMERELKVWEEIENRPKSRPFENVLQKLEQMKRDEDSTEDSVINSVKLREEDEQLVNDVRLAFERIGKLERLMHRSQKCQEAIGRVRELRNNALADVIREQSMCDPIALLRMLK